MYIHLQDRGYLNMEELGVENEKIRKQLRDAEILSSYPRGLRLSSTTVLNAPTEWRDLPDISEDINSPQNTANTRQVGGSHYKSKDIQPWDVVDQGPREQAIGFYRYNALKYIMRAGDKGEFKEDIAKAQHYLEKLLEIL